MKAALNKGLLIHLGMAALFSVGIIKNLHLNLITFNILILLPLNLWILYPMPIGKNYTKRIIMADTKAKKVLIVEDEGDMCLLLNLLLSGKGMELDHVKTLAGATEYLQETEPSVVILDNKLPDGLGMDYIPSIKKTYPALKIIMISGFDKAAADVALENGADTYMTKPFSKEQLFAAVDELV